MPIAQAVLALGGALAGLALTACGGGHGAANVLPSAPNGGLTSLQSVSSSAVSATTATPPMTSLAARDGASAMYPMADLSTTLTDVGPAHVNGTQGSRVLKNVAGLTNNEPAAVGIPGGAYDITAFDRTPPNAALQPSSALSVELWVKIGAINSSNNVEPLIAYGQQSPAGLAYTIQMRSPYDQLQFRVRVNSSKSYVVALGTQRLAVNQVYHVVGTYDGSKAQLYVDGVPDGAAAAGSGALYYYPGVKGQYGLAIGGEPLNTFAQPNVSIGNVAIYPKALSAASVFQHYLTGVNTPMVAHTPVRAQTFIDSIGVNTHFAYQTSQWDTHFSTIQSLLLSSGIRHIRDELVTPWTPYYTRVNQLGAAGIKGDLVIQQGVTAAQIASQAVAASGVLEAFEGVNEPDLDGTGWQTWARSTQQLLYTTVNANPATALYPVIGTSVTSPQAAQTLGNMSGYLDFGNLHNYYGQDNPGTFGSYSYHAPWGWGGSAAFSLGWVSAISANKTVMTTETGYDSNTSFAGAVSPVVQGKYVARLFFEQFKAGIARTYIYEFMDEPYRAGQSFCYNGLVDTSFNPKPSYYAMQSIIGTLADPGSTSYTFPTSQLTYAIGGNVANVHSLLMQRHDGTYQLAFWLETQDWDLQRNVELYPAAQRITLTLPTTPSSAQLTTVDTAGHRHTAGVSFSGGTTALNAADTVSILTFK